MSGLYEKLKKYGEEDICPMHMPGHKRKTGLCREIDITEIGGFDNLANPQGVLKELQNSWAKMYGADKAYISVNGVTPDTLSNGTGIPKDRRVSSKETLYAKDLKAICLTLNINPETFIDTQGGN